MRHFKKIRSVCSFVALGLLALTGCEDEHFYDVNSPDWLSERVDSIANSGNQNEILYTIGSTDYSTAFWTAFSEYYVIPEGRVWTAVFDLHIDPNATNTYKNFALVITNDVDRDGTGYQEYGVIRFDNQPSGNSEWGTYIDRSYVQSTLTFETDTDEGIEQLGGRVTLTVDRSNPVAFNVTMTNGTVTKTYNQPTALVNLNTDESNTNIRCFLTVEGSYIDFRESQIVEGEAVEDQNPISLELQNVPESVDLGTPIDSVIADVSAVVTFEGGGMTTVSSSELTFSVIPDMDTPGVKNLVAVYNKTQLGSNCDQPVMASATFELVERIVSIEVTTQPSRTTYYYYTSAATEGMADRTLVFDPTGMVVTATDVSGGTRVLDNSKLTFSTIPATVGDHTVTITAAEGVTATVSVNVSESVASEVHNSTNMVGAEDNSTAWWTVFSDDFNVPAGETKFISFTNYTNGVNNWNNYSVVLRKADLTEYAVVRADNYGWGAGYENNANLRLSGGQSDWAAWLAEMNGAKVTVYVTNCGNGTADVQAVMQGAAGTTYTQYYLGINTVDLSDLNFALTMEGCHLVFNE